MKGQIEINIDYNTKNNYFIKNSAIKPKDYARVDVQSTLFVL